jgi:hypothetical protein
MDTRFPTPRNLSIWKGDDLTDRVKGSILYTPGKVNPRAEINPETLNPNIDLTILDNINRVTTKTQKIDYTITPDFQVALLIGLSQAGVVYESQGFGDFAKKMVPDVTDYWMSSAQMTHLGFEVMKLCKSCQPLDLRKLYTDSIMELRATCSAQLSPNQKIPSRIINGAYRAPKLAEAGFEDLVTVNQVVYQYPFKAFVKKAINTAIRHLETEGKLKMGSELPDPGKKIGNPNHRLIYIPAEFIKR